MLIVVLGASSILSSLILAVSALFLLVFGVFYSQKNTTIISHGAILAIILATLAIPGDWFNFSTIIPKYLNVADDHYTRLVMGLIYFVGILVLYGTYRYMDTEHITQFEYPVLMLLSMVGMTIYLTSNDLIYFFMGLELQSLAIYVMVAMNRHHVQVSESAVKYFILGAISTVFILYGSSFIYGYTGSTDFSAIANQMNQFEYVPLAIILGFLFIIAGLAFKISAVPFHMWTPDVYEGTPTPVVAFIASAPKLVALAFFVRIIYGPFGQFINEWQLGIQILAVLSILVGVFTALYQSNLKRLFAYSTISHMGYILVGVSCASFKGVHSVLVYLILYAFMTVGVFLALIHLRRHGHSPIEIKDLKGLSRTNPLMALALTIFMFSLAGIPPFAGFFAKFGIIMAAVDEGFTWLAVLVVLGSVVGAAYYLRIIKVMYFDELASKDAIYDCKKSQETGLAIAICVLITTLYIWMPKSVLHYATDAANVLFAG